MMGGVYHDWSMIICAMLSHVLSVEGRVNHIRNLWFVKSYQFPTFEAAQGHLTRLNQSRR